MSTTIDSPSKTQTDTTTMNLRIYNTLTRQKEVFEPVVPGKVGIYLCGPTVYAPAHIGHMVGPVIFDTIKRYLTYSGYDVTWVVNVTDVDDKLIQAAKREGVEMSELAKEMTKDYLSNLAGMGVDQIDEMPTATGSMGEIIKLTKELVDSGHAYAVDGDVFFDVGKDAEYGKLTNRTVDKLQGEGGGAAAKKKTPADFALWKSAKEGEPAWESPWGKGRPGWHIECSAMSRQILGETFDIHGGGLDLIFPHHENEIAQSECCHGKPMAKYWMHNGLLRREEAGKIGGRSDRDDSSKPLSLEEIQQASDDKESRSKGAGGLASMIKELGGETIRFFLLRTHYRSTCLLGDEAIAETKQSLQSFYRFFERVERVTKSSFYSLSPVATRAAGAVDSGDDELLQEVAKLRESFLASMDDDFNTGAAFSDVFDLLRTLNKFIDANKLEESGADAARVAAFSRGVNTLRELTAIFGLFREPIATSSAGDDELVGKLMDLLIELRADLRGKKDFETADKLRATLTEIGITLEDRKDETLWRIE
ncbi:MAG: cysteinyl-tRNA synthetase [Pirellulaceae bacterium]|jgi:cysteinyl-tRNA synthetase